MKIAILYDPLEKLHSTSWSAAWVIYCKEYTLEYDVINPYEVGVINKLMEFDIILWHYSNYSYKDMLMAKNVLYTMAGNGKLIFPSFNDAWHFDDKLAETYLLESINAPIPKSFYYYDMDSLISSIDKLTFPIIAKLRNGSGSHNVIKLMTEVELFKYSEKMFSRGISSAPSLLFKTSSNIRSSKNLKTFVDRFKRIPEFLRSLSNARKFNKERGYVYLQEFIPNDGYDLKIVVIGDKLSFIGRNIRDGEFRASGSGDLFYDRKRITQDIIDSAFRTSDLLGFQCMGYDYVVNSSTQKGIIIEMSYGFSHEALRSAGGYFDRNFKWHDESLNVPAEILKNIIDGFGKT